MNISPNTKATITIGMIFGAAMFIWGLSAAWAGKADKSEVSDIEKRMYAAEKAQASAEERSRWILEDVKKANDKLDKILNALYFPRDSSSLQPPAPTPAPMNR